MTARTSISLPTHDTHGLRTAVITTAITLALLGGIALRQIGPRASTPTTAPAGGTGTTAILAASDTLRSDAGMHVQVQAFAASHSVAASAGARSPKVPIIYLVDSQAQSDNLRMMLDEREMIMLLAGLTAVPAGPNEIWIVDAAGEVLLSSVVIYDLNGPSPPTATIQDLRAR